MDSFGRKTISNLDPLPNKALLSWWYDCCPIKFGNQWSPCAECMSRILSVVAMANHYLPQRVALTICTQQEQIIFSHFVQGHLRRGIYSVIFCMDRNWWCIKFLESLYEFSLGGTYFSFVCTYTVCFFPFNGSLTLNIHSVWVRYI